MYKYAVEAADSYGVEIAMETDMTMEKHFEFLDQFDGKLKLCFDTHNPVMYGTGYPPDMIRSLGTVSYTHLLAIFLLVLGPAIYGYNNTNIYYDMAGALPKDMNLSLIHIYTCQD